jgi:hypothetical protein
VITRESGHAHSEGYGELYRAFCATVFGWCRNAMDDMYDFIVVGGMYRRL